jgi:hypothetical protein
MPDKVCALQTALFAGRRATDRGFLLLQNLFCQRHLPGYSGSSSVYAVTLLERAMRAEGIPVAERKAAVGALLRRGALRIGSYTLPLTSMRKCRFEYCE